VSPLKQAKSDKEEAKDGPKEKEVIDLSLDEEATATTNDHFKGLYLLCRQGEGLTQLKVLIAHPSQLLRVNSLG